MWIGRLERLDPLVERNASRSIELISPTNSRRLARSKSRKCSRSLGDMPAWFFLGLAPLVTAGWRVTGSSGSRLARFSLRVGAVATWTPVLPTFSVFLSEEG